MILQWLSGVFDAILGCNPRISLAPMPEYKIGPTCEHDVIEVTSKRVKPDTPSPAYPLAAIVELELQCAGCCKTWRTELGILQSIEVVGDDAKAEQRGEMLSV